MTIFCRATIRSVHSTSFRLKMKKARVKKAQQASVVWKNAAKGNVPARHQPQKIIAWPLTPLPVSRRQHRCVRVCVRRCPTQSIPLHSARPPQNKQLHQAPKNEKQIKRCGRLPERAAADCVRPYQWPCQPDDTVHTHTAERARRRTHSYTLPAGFPLGRHFVSSRVGTLCSRISSRGCNKTWIYL